MRKCTFTSMNIFDTKYLLIIVRAINSAQIDKVSSNEALIWLSYYPNQY